MIFEDILQIINFFLYNTMEYELSKRLLMLAILEIFLFSFIFSYKG